MINLAVIPAVIALANRRARQAERRSELRRGRLLAGGASLLVGLVTCGLLAGWFVHRRKQTPTSRVDASEPTASLAPTSEGEPEEAEGAGSHALT